MSSPFTGQISYPSSWTDEQVRYAGQAIRDRKAITELMSPSWKKGMELNPNQSLVGYVETLLETIERLRKENDKA